MVGPKGGHRTVAPLNTPLLPYAHELSKQINQFA